MCGKESYPTLAFNCAVSHMREFFSCTNAYPGTWNDKTLVKLDDFITSLRCDAIFTEFEYELFDADGVAYTEKGAYGINDGGYHKWPETMDAFKTSPYQWEMRMTERHESVRKDVECAFGIVKKRWVLDCWLSMFFCRAPSDSYLRCV